MADIIRVLKERIPALRFIGKKYDGFGHWDQWFANGWFDHLEQAMGGVENILALWENGGGYIGLERRRDGQLLEYWIGMFVPMDTLVPEGFEKLDFPEIPLGTCWIYGKEWEVHDVSGCCPALLEHGMHPWTDEDGMVWSFENCLCPRYTTPDDQGNVILDYCFFVQPDNEV